MRAAIGLLAVIAIAVLVAFMFSPDNPSKVTDRGRILTPGVGLESSHGDLKICNSTSSRVGVAVGYRGQDGWTTEGWWNIASQTCETLLKGAVPSRFIYVHALDYDRGGEWAGRNFMCTDDKSFAIHGVQDCVKRGFKRTGFFEVDTGESQEWTIRLTDPEDQGANEK